VKRIRNNSVQSSNIIDGLSSPEEIANCFASRYRDLYTCVNYDYTEMQDIKQEFNDSISKRSSRADCIVSASDIVNAIHNLNAGKNDGNAGLSTDHFKNSCVRLCVHLSFLFSCMLVHDAIPENFTTDIVIPIYTRART
jgi:hypothetical protein